MKLSTSISKLSEELRKFESGIISQKTFWDSFQNDWLDNDNTWEWNKIVGPWINPDVPDEKPQQIPGPWTVPNPSSPYVNPIQPPSTIIPIEVQVTSEERKEFLRQLDELRAENLRLVDAIRKLDKQRKKEREQREAKEAEMRALLEQMNKMRDEFQKTLSAAEEELELIREVERKKDLY